MQRLVLVLCAMLIGGFVNASAASATAIAPENQPAVAADPAQKVRTAAFVIAAADSPDHLKAQADFVCPGTNDHTVINAAIAALPEPGGRVHLSAGNYSIGGVEGTYGGINILRSNVLLTGEGSGTRLMLQGGLADVNVIWIHGDICDVAVRDLYINGNGKQQIRNREKGWQGCNGIKAIDRGLGPSPRNIRVENCHIENCRLMAVMLVGDMVEVVNCYFTGSFGSHVIEILGRSGRIEGCTMWVRKDDVVGYGWATDACGYYHIVNNKIFVEEGGKISSHIFNNWGPFHYGGGSRTNLYHGIISGNIFVNNGKAGSVWLRGYVDVINNNIFRGVTVELGAQHIPTKLIGGGIWQNFEHNMLVNSPLTIDSLDDNEEYFTFINGNAFVNSPVNYKRGNVIWGKNPGYVTENSGVATIAGDQTQIVVAHGLAAAAQTVHVTPAGNLGQAAKFWVDEIGEREFTIKLDAAPGADTPFHWRAVIADIVSTDKQNAGLSKGVENPEVPVYVPDKPGIKVGIYHSGIAAKELMEALNREPDINAFILPRMDSDALSKCDVFILPQSGGIGYIKAGIPGFTNWVADGGGALLLHGVLDWPMFPGVGASDGKMRFNATQRHHRVRPGVPHTITTGMSTNDWFEPMFQFDHIIVKLGPDGTAAIVNDVGAPVVVTGPSGKGRVALNGMLPGLLGARDEPSGRNRQAPDGAELNLLLNTVRWLAGDRLSAEQP